MARTVTDIRLETRSARGRLPARKKPYYRLIDAGRHLGYYKGPRGGTWLARLNKDGSYRERTLGAADDVLDADGHQIFTFSQAQAAAREWFVEASKEPAEPKAQELLIRDVIATYVAERGERERQRHGPRAPTHAARSSLTKHVLRRSGLGELQIGALTVEALRKWRREIEGSLSTRQRVTNDFKAALNSVPADGNTRYIIKEGLATPISEVAAFSSHAGDERSRILDDEDVRRLLRAIEQEGDEDVFHMCHVLAATGTRFAQACRLRVGDFQAERRRLLIPPSFKGRPGSRRAAVPVQLGDDTIELLLGVVAHREKNEILLERWRRVQVKGAIWEKDRRGPWTSAAELTRPIRKAARSIGLPSHTSSYVFRHSSIMRALRDNQPTRLVAQLHDTSIQMIERNYTAYLADALEELARRAIIPLR